MTQDLFIHPDPGVVIRRRLIVTLAMGVIFAVSFRLFQKNAEDAARPSVGTPYALHAAPTFDALPEPSPQVAAPAHPEPPVAVVTGPTSAGVAAPAEGELPVKFFFRAARDAGPATVSVLSLSDDPLDLTVTVVNAATHLRSVVDLRLVAHQRKSLLEELPVGSGDQVTLHSFPFPDKTLVVQ